MNEIIFFYLVFWYILFNIEREGPINNADTSSSLSSYTVKIHAFFNGVFLPAAVSFKIIREQIRIDQEKTWQGLKPETGNTDSSWPKKYAVLIE